MSTISERQAMIAKIQKLPEQLEAIVKGLSEQQLDTPYREGGWTARQVVHHLVDSHANAFSRMKLVLTEDKPILKGYHQELWAELADYQLPIQPSLAIIQGLHERWTALLNSITESQWGRTGMHTESGEVSLDNLLVTYSNHGEKHVGHIRKLRTDKSW